MDTEATTPDTQQTTGKSRSRKKMWLLFCIGITMISGTAITPGCKSIEESRDAKCRQNLKSLSLAAMQYTMDYGSCFPNNDGMEGLEKL